MDDKSKDAPDVLKRLLVEANRVASQIFSGGVLKSAPEDAEKFSSKSAKVVQIVSAHTTQGGLKPTQSTIVFACVRAGTR